MCVKVWLVDLQCVPYTYTACACFCIYVVCAVGAVDIFGDVSSSDEDDENDGSAAPLAEDTQPLRIKAALHPADGFESRDDTLDSEFCMYSF